MQACIHTPLLSLLSAENKPPSHQSNRQRSSNHETISECNEDQLDISPPLVSTRSAHVPTFTHLISFCTVRRRILLEKSVSSNFNISNTRGLLHFQFNIKEPCLIVLW